VATVCFRVGYRNLSNVNRQLRSEHALTPREDCRSRQGDGA
jgi:AraC-like DNA-binding protein